MILALALWLLSRLYQEANVQWPGVGGGTHIIGGGGGVNQDVRNLVNDVANGLRADETSDFSMVAGQVAAVSRGLTDVANFGNMILTRHENALNYIEGPLVNSLLGNISNAQNAATNHANDLFNSVEAQIHGMTQAAPVDLGAERQWVIDNVFNPLHGFALALHDDAVVQSEQKEEGQFIPEIAALQQQEQQTSACCADNTSLLSKLLPLLALLPLLLAGWLFDFLRDPLGWLLRQISRLAIGAAHVILNAMVAGLVKDGSVVEDFLATWVSS